MTDITMTDLEKFELALRFTLDRTLQGQEHVVTGLRVLLAEVKTINDATYNGTTTDPVMRGILEVLRGTQP